MAQWGKIDQQNNAPGWSGALVNKVANTGNRNAMYGNTTANAFVNGQIVGVFGADAAEVTNANGSIISITVTNPGSGYGANATVTLSGNGTANATANSIGKISAVNITSAGSGYGASPTVAIAAPAARTFPANTTGVTVASDFILLSTNVFQNGDKVTYTTSTGNTALGGLTNGAQYFVRDANTSGIKLAATSDGAAIDLSIVVANEAGHNLVGETATAVATVSGKKGIAHPGWQLRREGTGGRAGRVQYETLVATSMTGDGSDDTILKDS